MMEYRVPVLISDEHHVQGRTSRLALGKTLGDIG